MSTAVESKAPVLLPKDVTRASMAKLTQLRKTYDSPFGFRCAFVAPVSCICSAAVHPDSSVVLAANVLPIKGTRSLAFAVTVGDIDIHKPTPCMFRFDLNALAADRLSPGSFANGDYFELACVLEQGPYKNPVARVSSAAMDADSSLDVYVDYLLFDMSTACIGTSAAEGRYITRVSLSGILSLDPKEEEAEPKRKLRQPKAQDTEAKSESRPVKVKRRNLKQ